MKIGIIGGRGHWGTVLQSLSQVPGAVIAGISEATDQLRSLTGNPPEFSDYREMLERIRPDIVCVDGWFHQHAEMCLEAIKRDIAVYCEKPIALTLPELAAIRQALQEHPVPLISITPLRYEPAFATARQLVAEGAIGKVKLVRSQKSYKLGQRADFYRRRETYGGTIPWVGSHGIDLLMLFGADKFLSVTAMHDCSDNFGLGEMEITAQCIFRCAGGILASTSLDFLRPAAAPTHGDDRVRVAGTSGVIEVIAGEITLINAEGEQKITPQPVNGAIFSDFALGKSRISTEETLTLTEACLLARESADSGQTKYFPAAQE